MQTAFQKNAYQNNGFQIDVGPGPVAGTFVIPVVGYDNIDGYQVQWGALINGATGLAVGSTIGYQVATAISAAGGAMVSGFADKSVCVTGTFGAGGTVVIEGSNDGSTFFTLNDPFGNHLVFTVSKFVAVTEAVVHLRPRVTAGDGTTNLTVTMFFRRTNT